MILGATLSQRKARKSGGRWVNLSSLRGCDGTGTRLGVRQHPVGWFGGLALGSKGEHAAPDLTPASCANRRDAAFFCFEPRLSSSCPLCEDKQVGVNPPGHMYSPSPPSVHSFGAPSADLSSWSVSVSVWHVGARPHPDFDYDGRSRKLEAADGDPFTPLAGLLCHQEG